MENLKKNKMFIIIISVLIIIVAVLGIMLIKNNDGRGNKVGSSDKNEKNIKIVENEVNKLTLEDFSNSVFSMKKPNGWTVETGGIDIFYTIRVYDPQNTNNQIYLMLKMQPLLKTEAGKRSWQNYYNMSGNNSQYKLFADAVVLANPTTEEFYKKFDEIAAYASAIEPSFSTIKFPKFSNFTKQEEFESTASMKSVALIVNFGNNYLGGVDTSYYMVYDIMAITSEKDKFIDYKEILLESINSIKFSDSYVKQTIDNGNAQTKQALALNASIQRAFDSYMSAWENRSKSYDIMSQKQSDAILGYERVYDTETNDIYKAYNGFTDEYDGERYKSITDNMYTEKTSGYIEK